MGRKQETSLKRGRIETPRLDLGINAQPEIGGTFFPGGKGKVILRRKPGLKRERGEGTAHQSWGKKKKRNIRTGRRGGVKYRLREAFKQKTVIGRGKKGENLYGEKKVSRGWRRYRRGNSRGGKKSGQLAGTIKSRGGGKNLNTVKVTQNTKKKPRPANLNRER